jgi:hypothetical protein
MVWGELNDFSHDCYVCLTNITRITSKSKLTVKCPDLPSAMSPVPNSEELLVSKPSIDDNFDSEEEYKQQEGDIVDCNSTLQASYSSSEPHLLIQEDLNDLVRDCKSKAIPGKAWTGPKVSRSLTFPDFKTIGT